MDKIFEASTKISTPLGLTGFCVAVLCYIYLQTLKKTETNKLRELSAGGGGGSNGVGSPNPLLLLILKYVFILALVATVIGVSGFTFKEVYPLVASKGQKTLRFSIYINDRPVGGVNVIADNVETSNESNRDGVVSLTFNVLPGIDSLHLLFKSDQYGLDTVKTEPLDKFPPNFKFAKKTVATATATVSTNTPSNSGTKEPSSFKLTNVIKLLPTAIPRVVTGSDTARLKSVTFFTHTNDDDKDHDTYLYVVITTADLTKQIALANRLGDGITFQDQSNQTLVIPIVSEGMRKGECQKFHVNIVQYTNGNDTWKYNCLIALKFSDGSEILATQNDIVLKNSNASISFAAQ